MAPPDNDRGRPGEKAASRSNSDSVTVPPEADSARETPLTKADRASLATLARKRGRLAKAQLAERAGVLRADVEDQLAAEYAFDDELWSEVNRAATAAVATADQQIAETCRRLGIPDTFRPSLTVGWRGRGENMLASRRAELRRLAHARIDAAVKSAGTAIENSVLDVETQLIRDGLDSTAAAAFLDAMPTAEQLLPPVQVGALDGGHDRDEGSRYRSWQPPEGATGQLLTPSSASSREERRRATLAALTADPHASDRAIARTAGVDHKTVARLRAVGGEVPTDAGEVPTAAGEVGR